MQISLEYHAKMVARKLQYLVGSQKSGIKSMVESKVASLDWLLRAFRHQTVKILRLISNDDFTTKPPTKRTSGGTKLG
jgi:hypothetical protein